MKRALLLLLALPFVFWLGFRVWLASQPEDLQVLLANTSTEEFLRLVREEYVPREVIDFGAYGRREAVGRGHDPWVLRANLDGQPRMMLLALAPETWLSIHTPTGSLQNFWRGSVDFRGPVYDTHHGVQPVSVGSAYLRGEPEVAFWLREGERWVAASARYRGHSFEDDEASVKLRYALGDERAPLVVSVSPEIAVDPRAPRRVGLTRRFEIEHNPRELRLALPVSKAERAAGARFDLAGARLIGGPQGLRIEFDAPRAEVTLWFGEPTLPLDTDPKLATSAAETLIAESDCSTCHHEHERMTGPSWQEIARRHADGNRDDPERLGVVAAHLGRRIRSGGSGAWGSAAMPPHPGLSEAAAEQIAWSILGTEAKHSSHYADAEARERFEYSYEHDTSAAPATLHPSLRKRRLDAAPFTPAVGGLTLLPDGRLAVATWDRDGAVFAIDHWNDDEPVEITRIAEGMQEPLGLEAVGDALYVLQKQEVTELIDRDGDGRTDEYRTLDASWQTSGNFHEFSFGLVEHEGFLYGGLSACVQKGGKSCATQLPDRGRVFRLAIESGELEFLASGFRTPNGIGIGAQGELLVTDNQGDWVPASKLVRVERGAFYGWRSPLDAARTMPPSASPALWLPHHEVANSPTQPIVLEHGPFAGQLLFGDVYNGGLKRAVLEEVDGVLQGAAFHFSGGLVSGVNRILEGPEGRIVVGEVGNPGNWGQHGKEWFGLEVLEYTGELAFEARAVRATNTGFAIEFTKPLAPGIALDPADLRAEHWFYVESERYGGPKFDPKPLPVRDLRISEDRRTLTFDTPDFEAGRVVYLKLPDTLQSESGEGLWVDEAWYTLNVIPGTGATAQAPPASQPRAPQPAAMPVGAASPPLLAAPALPALSEEERALGWRWLFDGESFRGWRNYGAGDDEPIEGWAIEDGTLRMTRDTSFLRFAWNFVNPFTDRPLLDLRSEEKFGPRFEVSLDWKISEGGNSGIFYLVPDDEARVAWKLGLEMQVLDNDGHSDGAIPKHRAGDLYDLVASRSEPVRPVGAWNTARIRVDGDHIQHWLNDELVVDVHRSGPEWEALLAASKFADREGYGQAERGHLVLQDHGDTVWYRNIKVRDLPPRPEH